MQVRNMLDQLQRLIDTWKQGSQELTDELLRLFVALNELSPAIDARMQRFVALYKSCRKLKKENKRLKRRIRELEAWVSDEDIAGDG